MRINLQIKQALPALVLAVVLLGGAVSLPANATGRHAVAAQGGGVQVFGPVTPGEFTGDLRGLPRAPEWAPGDPIKEIPRRHVVRAEPEFESAPRGFGMDPLAGPQAGTPDPESQERAFSSSSLNFAGLGFSGVNPPDPVGDVGRDYYFQMINGNTGTRVTVHNKGDGSVAVGPFVLDSLSSGGNCTVGLGDPIVLYDHLADRWLLSEFSSSGNNMCVYVSKTSDPISGGWWDYAFTAPSFPDYPKYAVWPDAYYVSTNENAPAAYALDRANMLQGNAATMQRFTAQFLAGFGFQALTPSDLDGDNPPVSGAPDYFMRHRDDEAHNLGSNNPAEDYLEIFEFDVDWATPANSTFALAATIAVSEFDSGLCGFFTFSCFSQPGGGIGLDPLREVIMWRLQYRNFGHYETLVGNFVTDFNGSDRGAIRWFELRRQAPGVGNWTLYQEGTWGTSGFDRWMGSIAMDGGGNILLGYNYVGTVAPSDFYASLFLVGRLSTDTPGVIGTSSSLVAAGGGVNGSMRYGDYNAMTVDPVDDCTFWFTGEYNPTSSWGTRIATYRFAECPYEFEIIVGEEDAEPEGALKPGGIEQ